MAWSHPRRAGKIAAPRLWSGQRSGHAGLVRDGVKERKAQKARGSPCLNSKNGDDTWSNGLIYPRRTLRPPGLGDRHQMLTHKSAVPASNQARLRYGLLFAPRPAIQPVQRLSWAAAKVHALLVLLAAIFLISGEPVFTLYASGFLVAPTFLILAYLEARKAPLRITPISVYLFWNSFGLGFSAIFMGFKIAQGKWIDFSVAQILPDDLATGYVIYLLGSLAVHIGLNYMRPFENIK